MMSLSGAAVFLVELQPNETSPIIIGGQEDAVPVSETTAVETAAPGTGTNESIPAEEPSVISALMPILMWVGIMAAMYFIMIRPQRKQAKDMKVLQQNIRPGDNIVTSSGLYGKVMDVGEDVFVVEFGTNRGVRIPVAKSEIASIKVPKLTPPPAPPKE